MIDTQLVILLAIVVLTVLLVVVGIQVFYILRELRHTVKKANKVLDETGVITESVSGPISNLSKLATGLKTGVNIAKLLKGKKIIQRLLEEEKHGK